MSRAHCGQWPLGSEITPVRFTISTYPAQMGWPTGCLAEMLEHGVSGGAAGPTSKESGVDALEITLKARGGLGGDASAMSPCGYPPMVPSQQWKERGGVEVHHNSGGNMRGSKRRNVFHLVYILHMLVSTSYRGTLSFYHIMRGQVEVAR